MTRHHRLQSGNAAFRTALLAVTATVLFYTIAPSAPRIGDFVQRYFCSHPLEYISTAMFFTGLAILLQKYVRLRPERRVLSDAVDFLSGSQIQSAEPGQRISSLSGWCDKLPQKLDQTQLSHRLFDTVHYLKGSRKDGLEEHLRYLAELAGERLHQSFATIRTITWAIPILGFLGTVIGITMAIANVTPEQLDSSLGEVTGGLAVAFDTTALALGMSIVLVFASFVVERAEQNVLNDVEQFGIEILLPLFGAGESADVRGETGLSFAGEESLREFSRLWAEQAAGMSQAWNELLQTHVADLRQTLASQTEAALRQHQADSETARDVYAGVLRGSVEAIVDRTEAVMARFDRRVESWQQALQTSSEFSARQSEALHDLGAKLLKMTEAEERLAHIQQQLSDNLQTLEMANTMEQTANSLAAAVHVLTAKTSTSIRSAA
ncbi:MAG: MotA/TolQ/ExbB proton channel family protein [Planctomycetaceae bacterium]|nr:MotA/TolQ/ExbB proton channel family protein [Planctomycetaceae bacterium]